MAITICRDCGKIISTNAEMCANCGAPYTKYAPLDEYQYVTAHLDEFDFTERIRLEERMEELAKDDKVKELIETQKLEVLRIQEERIKKAKEEKEILKAKGRKRDMLWLSCSILICFVIFVLLLYNECSSGNRSSKFDDAYYDSIRVEDSISDALKEVQLNEKKEKKAQLIKSSIRITSAYTSNPNSAGGVDVRLYYKNLSSKTIKYFSFEAVPYNAVGDIVECTIRHSAIVRCKDTGPVKPGKSSGGTWSCMWYNYSIKKMVLTEVDIEYMDGSTLHIDRDEIPLIWK